MSASSNRSSVPCIPSPVAGVQINFCKNPKCANFGVPASHEKQPKGPGAKARGRDTYVIASDSYSNIRPGTPVIVCQKCVGSPPIKSNLV